jgi:hypothetical protein
MVSIGLFKYSEASDYSRFIKHNEVWSTDSEADRAATFWCVQNELIKTKTSRWQRVENIFPIDIYEIAERLDIQASDFTPTAIAMMRTNYNNNGEVKKLTKDDFTPSVYERMITLGREYGYGL